MRDVDHAALARSGVRLVVIGCGSYGLIRSYRRMCAFIITKPRKQHLSDAHPTEIFRFPYEIFVDASPGQMLYRALGMGHIPTGIQKARSPTDPAAGTYVRHGAVGGLAMVVAHALRVGMPVWERGGDASQLGGEFVLGPGYVYFSLLVAYDVLICGHRQTELYVRTPNAEHRWPCADRRRSRDSGSAFRTEGSWSRTWPS